MKMLIVTFIAVCTAMASLASAAHEGHGKVEPFHQKPGAPVRIMASGAEDMAAGVAQTLSYTFRSSALGREMKVSFHADTQLVIDAPTNYRFIVDAPEKIINLNVVAPQDGRYKINVSAELDGLRRVLSHRFIVGGEQAQQAKISHPDGIKRFSARETIRQK